MFAPESRAPPKTSPIVSRTVTPLPPPPQLPAHLAAMHYYPATSPPPSHVAKKLELQFPNGQVSMQSDSHRDSHSPPLVRPLPSHRSGPRHAPRAEQESPQMTKMASSASAPGASAHGDRPTRKPRSLPDSVPLPILHPLAGRGIESVISGALLNEPMTHVAVASPQSSSPARHEPVVSSPPPAHSGAAAAEVSHQPASPVQSLSVVVKGVVTVPYLSTPPPRVLEVSLASPSDNPLVQDVISQCVSLLGRRAHASDSRVVVDGKVTVESAVLEQQGVTLDPSKGIRDAGQLGELYFLSVVYGPLQQPIEGSPSKIYSATSRAVMSPDPRPASFDHDAAPARPAPEVVAPRLEHIEQRLAAVEGFIRAHSSPRDDEHRFDDAYQTEVDRYARPPPLTHSHTNHNKLVDDLSAIAKTTPSPKRYNALRERGIDEVPEELTYSAKAERIAVLALRSRQERLIKLTEMKRMVEERSSFCSWMEANIDAPGQGIGQVHRQHLSNLLDARTASLSGGTLMAATTVSESDRTDTDGVRVDYDPVLDLWRLRKINH